MSLETLRVDGGMTDNELLMQFQADIVNRAVVRPAVKETTALGAAYAAGLAVGVFRDVDDLRARWAESRRWLPQMDDASGSDAAAMDEGRRPLARLGVSDRGGRTRGITCLRRVRRHLHPDPAWQRRRGRRAAEAIEEREHRLDGHHRPGGRSP